MWQNYIDRLSEYMASTGKQYQSHAATIRRWAAEDKKKAAPQTDAGQKDAPAPVKKSGKTTYVVRVHFNETSKETRVIKSSVCSKMKLSRCNLYQ